jgi:hypothetical protein
MPAAKPFGSVTRIHRELQGKNKKFSAAKRTNRKRISRVLGLAAAAMLGCALISSQVVAQSPATFTSAALIDTSPSGGPRNWVSQAIATGDFNGDGKPDLIAIGIGTSPAPEVFVLLGNGDGTFSISETFNLYVRTSGDGINANNPNVLAVGDFNGDGKLDFAVYINGDQSGTNYVDVYLGDGTGNFSFSSSYTVGSSGAKGLEDGVVAADVIGNGTLDLLAINAGDNTLTVLLGNGNGTFQSGVLYSACNNSPSCTPLSLAVGDFNNGGHPDVAIADNAGGIDILLNNGNGTFQAPVYYAAPIGGFPDGEAGLATADLRGDGKLDVVLTGNSGAWVYLGNGDGTFQAPVNYPFPYGDTLAIADVNGDGKPDLVVPDFYNNSVWILLGNGDGTFQPAVAYATDWFPESVVVADFNGDGKPDFVVGSDNGPYLTLALGDGDGTFRTGHNYDVGNWLGEVAADFNSDGNLDVAVFGSNGNQNLVQVMLGSSHGVLGAPITTDLWAGSGIGWMVAGDVNGDGKPDLVATTSGSSTGEIAVMLGNGDGTFQSPVFYSTGSSQTPTFLVLADLRNIGKLDVVVSNADGSLSVLLNQGGGVYGTANVTAGVSSNGDWLATGDFNGDGYPDLAIADYYAADFSASKGLIILLGNGDGTFQSPTPIPIEQYGPTWVTVGDFNKDGKLDLAVGGPSVGRDLFVGGGLAILLGNGNGTFGSPTYYSLYPNQTNVGVNPGDAAVVADVNLDGNPDLLVPFGTTHVGSQCCFEPYNVGLGIFLGKGDGTFEFENALGESGVAGGPFLVGTGSYGVIAGDFNQDGAPDVAVLNQYNFGGGSGFAYVTMLLNTTLGHGTNNGTTTTLASSLNPAAYGQSVTFTATVATNEGGSPPGTVSFLDGGNQIGTGTLAGGQTALTISTLSVGSHSIMATYAGNGSFQPSNSAPLTEVVSPVPTTTSVSPSVNPSMYGQTVTFTTTVTPVPDGGTITLTIDGTVVGTGSSVPVSGLSVGSHSVFASYSGDTDYAGSTSLTLTQVVNPSIPPATYTLTLTELGLGAGTVTDNSSPTSLINCSEANGVVPATCSASYASGTTVVLTASPNSSPGFGGWSAPPCTVTASNQCSVVMNANQSITADFVAPPAPVTLQFTPGTNVTQMATFCPNNSNPCTDPNADALTLTIPQVTSDFSLTVMHTEIVSDGLCPAGGNGQSSDFACRLVSFFNYGTDPTTGDKVVPLCYPYANGNCVHYLVYSGTPGTEPPTTSYSGGVYWKIGYNNATFVPPGPYWTGAVAPRVLDDSDVDQFSPSLPWGTNCSTPMDMEAEGGYGTSTPTSPPIYCQFDADITTFFIPGSGLDPIGGKTKQPDDLVVAFLPTFTGSNPVQKLSSNVAPTLTGSCVSGCVISGTITFTEGTGGTFAVTATGFPTPTLAESGALPNGLTFNGAAGLISGTPADGTARTYLITFTATNSAGSATLGYTLTVNPAGTLTITASSPSMTYGGTVPAITPSYSGFVNGDSSASLTTQPTCSITGSPTKVATYTTSCSGAADANYSTISYVSGTLTVSPAGTLTITASSPSMTYGGAVPTITASGNGFVNGDTIASLTTQPKCTSSAASSTPAAGTYTTSCSGAADANYSAINYVNGTLRVSQAALIITASSATMTPGGTVPTITASYSGFVNGNTASSLTTQPTCTTTATSASPPSTYPSSCTGAVDPNYTITYVNGTVTVTASALEISPTSVNFGTLYLGEPAAQFVTLTNKGTTPITISSARITAPGNALGEFGDISFCPPLIQAMPGTLPAGKSCTIAVGLLAALKIFSPTASTATLTLTDSATGSPQQVPLTALVIDPQATLSTYSLNFGTRKEHTTSIKTVTLTNTGYTPLSLTSIAISGGSFTLSSGTSCASGMMNPSASCILNVTFTPESKGSFVGKVTITDNAFFSPQVITLAGTGD